LQIIDSQVHIWAADTPERPWAPNMEGRAHLAEPLSAERLLAMMDEAGVDAAILVPPSLEGDRNDLALAAAAKFPERFAVMGRLDFTKAQARAALPTWREQTGMLGIRLTFHRDDTRGQLTDGSADWLWAAAETHGVPLMVHAPERLPELGRIAERHPRLTLIVDHMGFARETMDAGAPAGAERVAALARYPNVFVKVSALPCFSSEPYPFRNLTEPVHRVIDAFGPRRSFWGTDLSRSLAHCTYRQGVTHFTEELTFLSADDLDWIMGRGLRECLRWNLPAKVPH
jgi:predicted TIM-barrel fold metal-dependent hydrolase